MQNVVKHDNYMALCNCDTTFNCKCILRIEVLLKIILNFIDKKSVQILYDFVCFLFFFNPKRWLSHKIALKYVYKTYPLFWLSSPFTLWGKNKPNTIFRHYTQVKSIYRRSSIIGFPSKTCNESNRNGSSCSGN